MTPESQKSAAAISPLRFFLRNFPADIPV